MPRPPIDITGETWNGITAIRRKGQDKPKDPFRWEFKCHCGNLFTTFPRNIRDGMTRSCGCLPRGGRRQPARPYEEEIVFQAWRGMHYRCKNKNFWAYHNWGGRGIKVCERWNVYENFRADMGLKPSPKHSLDRIDNNDNYSPENCRWATAVEQRHNQRNACFTKRALLLSQL